MFASLKKNQLEEKMQVLRNYRDIPKKGWIKTIREACHLSTKSLALRMRVSQSNIVQAEKAEVDKRISLTTLTKIADALNCDVQYALIPRIPIEDYLKILAEKKAKQMTQEVIKTMELEAQGINKEKAQMLYNQFLKELLEKPKILWKE